MRDATVNSGSQGQSELLHVYAPMARTFVLFIACYYCLLSLAHLVVLKGQLAILMSTIAASTCVGLLGAYLFWLRKAQTIVAVEKAILLANLAIVINISSHQHLAHDPQQFVYLLMLAFACAIIGPSMRLIVSTLVAIAISALYLTLVGPASAYVNNGFTLLTALAGGFASGNFLHKSVRAQAKAQIETQALLVDVERERARAQTLAQEADFANRAKTDFLANMSHELRTPLNGVVGIANALASTPLSQTQKEMVNLIDTSGRTLARLLSDILDFSKIEAGKIEIERAPFDLHFEIEATALLLKSKAEDKGLVFSVKFGDEAKGWFLGDVTRIKQIVANLMSNAVKFTQQGSILIEIDWSSRSEILEIKISDTGIGFDAETGKRLFNRFVQADTSITRRFGGTGLGLSICRGLIEAMGGGLNWNSEIEKGSTFIVRLPLEPCEKVEQHPLAARSHEFAETEQTQALRVLAAEDHPTNQRVLKMILEPLGVDLVICEDGDLAYKAFCTSSFDVVLMDMQMPVMDGVTATEHIRAFEVANGQPPVPIIMITANAMRHHRDQAIAAGANMHVTKPFTPQDLIDAIETALDDAGNTEHPAGQYTTYSDVGS